MGARCAAVFSGTHCSNIPAGAVACDNLEKRVVRASSWGTRYVGGRHPVRITSSSTVPERVYRRVIAGVGNMTIQPSPAVAGGCTICLGQAGSFAEFSTTECFVAGSGDPFMLVQYMASCRTVTPVSTDADRRCVELWVPPTIPPG